MVRGESVLQEIVISMLTERFFFSILLHGTSFISNNTYLFNQVFTDIYFLLDRDIQYQL